MKFSITAALLLCTAAAFATPTGDFQAGKDASFRLLGGSYSLNSGGTTSSGSVQPVDLNGITKPASSLNGYFVVNSVTRFLGLNSNATFVLSGSIQPNNIVRFSVSAPGLVGKTVTFYLGQSTMDMTVTGVAGTFNFAATTLGKPQTEYGYPFNARDTGLASDPILSNAITFTGTVNGVATTLSCSHLKFSGVGGLIAANYVSNVSVSSAPAFMNVVQGGTPAKILITLAKPVAAKTTVKLAYNGSGISGPSAVSVAAGAMSTTATLNTAVTSAPTPFAVRATVGTYYDDSPLCSVVPALGYFTYSPVVSANPLEITAAVAVTGTFRTITAVGANTVVSLYCSNPNISIPPTVTIAAGGKQASFAIKTQWVSNTTPVTFYGIIGNSTVAVSQIFVIPGTQQVSPKRP